MNPEWFTGESETIREWQQSVKYAHNGLCSSSEHGSQTDQPPDILVIISINRRKEIDSYAIDIRFYTPFKLLQANLSTNPKCSKVRLENTPLFFQRAFSQQSELVSRSGIEPARWIAFRFLAFNSSQKCVKTRNHKERDLSTIYHLFLPRV
ncbi:hypothetical protein CEXT_390431 [Caerostris extrusa]|uniref:Uncharacterized protein n=1 Tax=Caerostris extrusa TaxID=172846 RepID=A0AAV4QCM3_CAEEX|nr:hypothetical protein CEXT_390431 [Caerostris extrusa]